MGKVFVCHKKGKIKGYGIDNTDTNKALFTIPQTTQEMWAYGLINK